MSEISKEEEALNKVLIDTYFANLKFLEEYDNNLYKRVQSLSEAINTGIYKERYHLEFIKEKGDFDILDTSNDEYLYKKKAKQTTHKLSNNIKFDKSMFFSSLVKNLYNLDRRYKDVNLDYESYEELQNLLFNTVKEFTDILKDDTLKEKEFKRIEKFIFIGTLLGRHIPSAVKKVNAKNYFVCENNLEIFRLSLFVTSYVELAQESNVRFSIMDNQNEFIYKFQLFLEDNLFENYYLKYVTTDYNVSRMMHDIISTMYKTSSVIFDYTRILHNMFKLTAKNINKNKILTIENKPKEFDFVKDKPVLFVASGPSLELHMNWLEENKDKFVIVAIGGSYKKLLKHGIKADIISTIDSGYKDLSKYHFTDDDIKNIQDTIVIAAINSPEQICRKLNQDLLFYFEIYFALKNSSRIYDGYSVGEITVAILVHLGVKELYLLGTDLAVNPDTGETHIGNYHNSNRTDIKDYNISKSLVENSTSFNEEAIPVKGNLNKEVFTTRIFNASIFAYGTVLKMFKQEDQNVYNLSTNGAYLEGTIPLNINSLDISSYKAIKKDVLSNELYKGLIEVSEVNLNQEELNRIKEEIDYFSNLREEVLNKSKLDINGIDELKELFNNVEKSLREIGRPTFLYHILIEYFKITNTYINYYFNDKKIKNETKKIKQVKEVWLKQVEKILLDYINYLKEI